MYKNSLEAFVDVIVQMPSYANLVSHGSSGAGSYSARGSEPWLPLKRHSDSSQGFKPPSQSFLTLQLSAYIYILTRQYRIMDGGRFPKLIAFDLEYVRQACFRIHGVLYKFKLHVVGLLDRCTRAAAH